VALPASYGWAQDRRYPVLYVLDGRAHFAHAAAAVDYLAAQGEIPEMIVVALDSTNRVRDFTQSDWAEAWVGGGGAANFRRFLADELIPQIARDYRTDGFRVLSGHSAGGQFALYSLGSAPALFKGYFALSPSLDWDHNLPQRSLEASLAAAKRVPAFLYFASSDDSGQALADDHALVATLRAHAPEGFRWKYQPFPDETHGGLPLLAQIDALRALYAGYRFHPDQARAGGLPAAEAHFQAVSKLLDWPMQVPEGVLNDLGYAALSQGRTADAVAMFERNTRTNPNSANAWDSLADGYAQAKQWPDALTASDRAVALATRYALPNRADFERQAQGRHEQARQQAVVPAANGN
jgi:predicted alpha/beta superfamily hydrolase